MSFKKIEEILNKDYPMYEMHKKLILHEIWEDLYHLLYIAPSPILHLASKYEDFEEIVYI